LKDLRCEFYVKRRFDRSLYRPEAAHGTAFAFCLGIKRREVSIDSKPGAEIKNARNPEPN